MRKTVSTLKACVLVATCLALTVGCSVSPVAASDSSGTASTAAGKRKPEHSAAGSATRQADSAAAGATGQPGAHLPGGLAKRQAGSAPAPAAAADGWLGREEVRAFVDELVERHGFDAAGLAALFAQVRRSDDALRLMSPPPRGSFKRSWRGYRSRFIDQARIVAGVRFWREHEEAVQRASLHYGVPEEIIVSIIGVETVYGRVTGNHRVADVLTTLAFDFPRRADYFRGELEQYLLLARQQGFDPLEVRGSYAGAIGLPQFMPGSIHRWAVDFDGDGRIDLRGSAADAIGSVANFLVAHGWAPGEPLRYRALVANPARIGPLVDAGILPGFTIGDLREHGVDSADLVSVDAKLALIELPNADDPPDYWLGGQNFYVITRYNRSSFYAMAVIELAEALRDARGR